MIKTLMLFSLFAFSQLSSAKTCREDWFFLTNVRTQAVIGDLVKTPVPSWGSDRGMPELYQVNVWVEGDYEYRGKIYRMAAWLSDVHVTSSGLGYFHYRPFYYWSGVVYIPWALKATMDTFGSIGDDQSLMARSGYYDIGSWNIKQNKDCSLNARAEAYRYGSEPH